jgi:hypothetical protein
MAGEHHVGVLREFVEQGLSFAGRQVEGDRPLAVVAAAEIRGAAVPLTFLLGTRRAPAPGHVAARRRVLDLHDRRA